MTDGGGASLEALLDFLKRSRGFDFTGYKRAALERRFKRRMESLRCGDYGDYLDYLEVHPEEYEELFDTLLVNVTDFFRDPGAWERLRATVIPELLESKAAGEPIRVWSAGCASGQEAYSLAMSLAEALGAEEYRRRVKIYGTDVDEDALAYARAATFTAKEVESVPDELLGRYFEPADRRHAFRADLRRTVIFGRNNLLEDAPISRLDLLVCRNTMMYFTADRQERILRNFHFGLVEGGALMLGKSEMMLSHRSSFAAIDLPQRIFRREGRAHPLRPRVADLGSEAARIELELSVDERIDRDVALEVGLQPQMLVSRTGVLTFANLAARMLFGIPVEALGQPFRDLEVSYQPVDLRTPVEEALRERRRVPVGQVSYTPQNGEARRLEITVSPLLPDGDAAHAAAVVFDDVTRFGALETELETSRRDLQLAYEELQSTIDELETTNEELQSANEELQTTNEELQSTNEELETMNEELQSTNEELETINDVLRDRTVALNRSNEFLEAILSALGLAVVIVDRDHRVLVWNLRAEDLWGVRQDEAVGKPFLALDIGLPTEQVAPVLRDVLGGRNGGRGQLEVDAVNRRGRAISCSTTIMAFDGDGDGDGEARSGGAIILMRDAPADGGGADGAGG
jgi:two-component system CheB/CheR fusion protein